MSTERFRDFFVRTYLNELTLVNLFNKNLNTITRFCFAEHNKDTKEDGTPKEPHIHIVIRFKNRKSINAVKEFFPTHNDLEEDTHSTYVEVLKDERIAIRYLLHKDTPDKYQYDRSIIFNNGYMIDTYLNNDLKIEKCDTSILALCDLLDGLTLRECALKYGRDFIIHYSQFRLLLLDINQQERFFTKVNNDNDIDTFLDFNKLPSIN